MGFDPTVCYNSIVAAGNGPCPNALGTASSYHCLDAQESGPIHVFCSQAGIYYSPFAYSEAYDPSKCAPNEYNAVKCDEHVFADINDLVTFIVDSGGKYKSRPCYCCCSCLAYGTPIAIPSGMNAIEKIVVGDLVMGASMQVAKGKISFEWTPETVSFSQGTPPSSPTSGIASTMVFIYCDGDLGLIATQDQLMLLSTGKMKQAGTLVPDIDLLVSVDGSAIPIQSVKIGNWQGGVHHITINKSTSPDVNGHLLNANGIVIGDFQLQINPQGLGDMFEAGPMIGSDEYHTKNKSLNMARGVYGVKKAKSKSITLPKHFNLFSETSSYIPADASRFITTTQAIDIVGNPDAHFRPFGNKSGISGINYLFQLYKGFFPDFNFYLDWDDISPNAYAFNAYGVKNVVISGGLVRLDGLYIEGQAFIIAHCIARLMNLKDYKGPHPLPTIEADYYGMGLVMPMAWSFNVYGIDDKAIAQMTQLWGYIAPEDRGGNPLKPQEDPSIDCRIRTLMFAQLGGELPPCAKPPVQLLEITGAETGITVDKKPYVILTFNRVVDQESAQKPANYAFDPAAQISSVQVQQTDGLHVQIIADFATNVNYNVTVKNVTAGDGAPLDPKKSSITFKGE